jgi:glycosyltransferase involved in cell wall biosynthesis
MNVLITYSSYPSNNHDWRARFMYDMLHSLARKEGLQIRAWGPPGPLPSNQCYVATQYHADWMTKMLEKGGIAHLLRSKSLTGIGAALKLSKLLRQAYIQNSDVSVYHINWMQNALLLPNNNVPCLITVLGTDFKLLQLPGMTSAFRQIFKKHRCILAPNGDWMESELIKRFNNVIYKIKTVPFGIEDRWYNLQRKVEYDTPRRWVSVIRLTEKKVGPLFKWGEKIFTGNDELHLYGPNQGNISIPSWVKYHGSASPEHLVNDVYPGAYGYISLSQHDEGRPQAILEAMAAGLPIIASDIYAHRNLLESTNGARLVSDAEMFIQAIQEMSRQHVHQECCNEVRKFIMKKHGTWDSCADRYEELYQLLVEDRN